MTPKSKSTEHKRPSFRDNPQRWLIELSIIVAISIGLAFLVQALIIKPFRIPSPSMAPTLQVGQKVLVNRIGARFSSPKVGDIVVFHPPAGGDRHDLQGQPLRPQCGRTTTLDSVCDQPTSEKSNKFFIKRIVAGPGDRIRLVNGQLIRNGKRIKEKYAQLCDEHLKCHLPREVTIPKGHYFVMGDNRTNSGDSRFWGPIPEDWIIGRAFATWWPLKRIGFM